MIGFSFLLEFLDIGANFPDSVFRGIYHGRRCHVDDFNSMLKRCSDASLTCVLSTSTSKEDFFENSKIINEFSNISPKILTTLGVHPTYSKSVFEGKECHSDWNLVDSYFEKMYEIFSAQPEHLIAIGECGLDYARLSCSPKEYQLKFFEKHFELLSRLEESKRPPMFLHMRDCFQDFIEILRKNREIFPGGVAHSFTGSVEEAKELLEFSDNLYIGLNGCSLRSEQGIHMASMIPLERIMIESDAPYCEMRPSHASRSFLNDFTWSIPKALDKVKHSPDHPVKGRNEPSETRKVLRVLSKLHEIDEEELSEIIYENTCKLFSKCK